MVSLLSKGRQSVCHMQRGEVMVRVRGMTVRVESEIVIVVLLLMHTIIETHDDVPRVLVASNV